MCLNGKWCGCVFASLDHVWHMRGFLQCHFNLARVRTDVFAIKFRLAHEGLLLLMKAMIALPLTATFSEEHFQLHVGRVSDTSLIQSMEYMRDRGSIAVMIRPQ